MDLCQIRCELCKGCELCIRFCPQGALELSEDLNPAGYHPAILTDPEKCNGCGLCAEMCPEAAMTIYRRRKHAIRQASTG